jgi:integrase
VSASLFRRQRIWQAKIKLDSWPRERRFSLGTTDRRVAQTKLAKKLRDFEYEAAGLLAPASVREAAQRPLNDLCAAFLADMVTQGKSDNTLRIYTGALRKVCVACSWKFLRDVTVQSFREWRNDCGLRPKTMNDYLNVCSRFLRWLRRQRWALENPFEFVDPVDARASAREYRRALTPDEVGRLLSSAPHPRRVVYLMILETGLRRRELSGLRWADFNLPSGQFACVEAASESDAKRAEQTPPGVALAPVAPFPADCGASVRVPASIAKNRRTEVLPLGADVVAELFTLRKPDTAPFQTVFAGIVPEVETFRRDLANAGIPFVDEAGRRVDLHSLRKTFGTALVLSGAHPRVVMQAMRHSDLKLTMKVYTDAGQLPVKQAVARLPWHSQHAEHCHGKTA